MRETLDWADGAPRVVAADGSANEADVVIVPAGEAPDDGVYVLIDGFQRLVCFAGRDIAHVDAGSAEAMARAPMHGRVVSVDVAEGAPVAVGDTLAVVEAMKMEHAVKARVQGTVAQVAAAAGDQVAQGALLVEITPAEAGSEDG